MRHFFLSVIAIFFLSGCGREIGPKDISLINGYWEIATVKMPDGQSKDYKINETIDFFKIDDNSGFRKKVMPQLNGRFVETGTSEKIKITFSGGKAFINYDSGFSRRSEEILEISTSELVLKDSDNLEYHYKKPVPFSIK